MDAWLIEVKGKKYAAPSLEVLGEWVRSGKVRREFPIFNPGTGEWRPAEQVAELRPFFSPIGAVHADTGARGVQHAVAPLVVPPNLPGPVLSNPTAKTDSRGDDQDRSGHVPGTRATSARTNHGPVPGPLHRLEQKYLFPATRILAWVMIVLLGSAALLGVLFFNTLSADSDVSYEEVRRAISSDTPSAAAREAVASAVPEKFKKYFQDGDEDVLLRWLAPLDDGQREEFLDGLWDVIKAAEKNDPTRLNDAINAYRSLKMAAFASASQNEVSLRLMRMATVAAILIVFGLAAIFALILAVLSLERRSEDLRARLSESR